MNEASDHPKVRTMSRTRCVCVLPLLVACGGTVDLQEPEKEPDGEEA